MTLMFPTNPEPKVVISAEGVRSLAFIPLVAKDN